MIKLSNEEFARICHEFTAASYGNTAAVTIRAIHMAKSRKG